MDLAEVEKFEQQTKLDRISALIREGCKTTLPLKRDWYKYDVRGSRYACALGAAMMAYGKYPSLSNLRTLPHAADALRAYKREYGLQLTDANDFEGITREQIADQLEALGY